MKIPKPKIKKPEFIKPGKPKSGNRFLKRNLLSLIVIAVLAIGTGTAYGTLSSQDADRGDDPVYGVDPDRYQVLVSGKGYKLNKQQEKQYKLQKKQNEANAAKALEMSNNARTISTRQGSRFVRSSGYSYRYRGSTFKVSKNPRISSNLKEQSDMEDSWKEGDTIKFKVSAFAYPYGTKNTISSSNIKVSITSGTASLYREDKEKGTYYYKLELGEGKKNKVTITATDPKTKKKSSIGPYTIKVEGSGSSSDSGGGTEPATVKVTATANLSEYGLGSIDLNGTVSSGQTAYDFLKSCSDVIKMDGTVIERIYLSDDDRDNFSLNNIDSSELVKIFKKDQDVTGDVEESEYAAWLDQAVQTVKDNGYIGKDSPFKNTKWKYEDKKITESTDINLVLMLYDD